jgi:hypothetical protein
MSIPKKPEPRPADLLFPKAAGAKREGICPICHQLIEYSDFRDKTSEKEYAISGLCQKCQDNVFGV